MSHNLRSLNTQNERTSHIVDTLRLSLEKATDDIYTRVRKLETEQEIIKGRLYQLEKYTGLRSNIGSKDLYSSANSMRDKDFS